MADFSIQATQLSPASGAGAGPVSPVQGNIMDNGVGNLLSRTMSIFEKGLDIEDKQKQDAQKAAIIGDYARRLQNISSGSETGALKRNEAAMRARALHGEFVAANPLLVKDIEDVRKSFYEGSAVGVAVDEQKAEDQSFNKLVDSARSEGIPIPLDADKATKQSFIDDYQKMKRYNAELDAMYRKSSEMRAMSAEERNAFQFRTQQQEIQLLARIGETTIDTTRKTLDSLLAQVAADPTKAQQASLEWAQWMSNVDSTIQAAGANNPSLASGYRSLFDPLRNLGNEMFKPGAQTTKLKNDLEALITQSQLQLVADPEFKVVVAASELLKGNAAAGITISSLDETRRAIMRVIGTDKTGKVPNFIGDKATEVKVFDTMKDGLSRYNAGTFKDKAKGVEELATGINNTLRLVGESVNTSGFKTGDLKGVADFFSDPAYGKFMQENPDKVDPKLRMFTGQVLEKQYTSQVVEGISKLAADKFDLSNTDVKFSQGGEITFLPKSIKDPSGKIISLGDIEQMNRYGPTLSKLIRLTAHNDGHSDYEKVWKEQKHKIVPFLYPYPAGAVVDGFVYSGEGDYRDKSNWKRKDGTK